MMAAPEAEGSKATRRQFGKRVALLAAAPLAAPALAAEDDKPKDKPVPVAVTEALVEAVRARYGKHLSRKQLEQLTISILRSQYAAERLRGKVKLNNADEPAFTFRADLP